VYRQLDPRKIVETAVLLQSRIHERFPGSGLGDVADELVAVTKDSAGRSARLGRPYLLLRAAVLLLTAAIVAVPAVLLFGMDLRARIDSFTELVQLLESGVNDVIFLGVAVFFLLTYEGRLKRDRALEAIHELRALAHIVDMHQLTKDPDRVRHRGEDTASSPRRAMDRFQLARYLDYCSEMLSVISKLAALYVQNLRDPAVLEAVDGLEDLTTGLSGKIWQKITILDRVVETRSP
jgi:hypothetical protein